jgi:hypothetical protein
VNLSTRAKALLAVGLLIGLVVWVVLLDYGINAGRIHYGVHVRGVNVGGMTLEEAMDVLQERGEEMRYEGVVLSAEGMNCSFIPDDVGWGPKPKSTAEAARDVGFRGGLSTSMRERIKAWFSGVRVDWADKPNVRKVTSVIDDCEEQAEALHLELDRYKLRRLMRRAIVTWPRRIFQVPVDPS